MKENGKRERGKRIKRKWDERIKVEENGEGKKRMGK